MIGTSFSVNTDSHIAGQALAASALANLKGERPAWAIAFATSRHAPETLFAGIRSVLGDVPVIGGAAFGVYTRQGSGYAGSESAIAVFGAGSPPARIVFEPLADGARAAGRRLGARLAATTRPGDSVLLYYDFVRSAEPLINHASSELLEGLYTELEPGRLFITGGATVGDFKFSSSFVFAGDRVVRGGVVAAVIDGGAWQPIHRISHGCTPVSTYLEVTRMDGRTIVELDGAPALDVLVDVAGIDEATTPMPSVMDLWLTLGVNHGDLWAPYDESDYVNYIIRDSDLEARTFTLTELSPPVGMRIRAMARDHRRMITQVQSCATQLFAQLPSAPEFTFITNCAGRITPFAGSKDGDAILHLDQMPDAPFLGFFSACELAPFNGVTRSMNWTEVLTSFVRR